MKKTVIDIDKLIPVWQTSDNLEQVLGKLKLVSGDKDLLTQKAAYLRSKGVPLKKMAKGQQKRIDWNRYAKLAEKFLPVSDSGSDQSTN